MSILERLRRRKVAQLRTPAAPLPQQEQQQPCLHQNPMRRLDNGGDYNRKIAFINLPSPSTREARRLDRDSSRPSELQLNKSTRSGFLLLVAAVLTAPSLRSGHGISRIGVRAETCSPGGIQQMTVSNGMTSDNLSTIFACDEGEFNVSWEGVVNVSKTITIGPGTTVRIVGESAVAIASTDSSSNIASSLLANSSTSDLELELEKLSNNLNLPQGLTSAAVGSVGLGNGSHSGDSFGPIFLVDGGVLHLESLAIRRGYSANSSSNVIVSGGGIHAINSSVFVSGCEFEDNFADNLGGGISADWSTLELQDSVFRGNYAGLQSSAGDEDADSDGGGIACENSNLYLDGCLFVDNYANKKGGGVHMGRGRVSVVNSLFFNNRAGSDNVDSEEPLGEGAAFSFTVCTQSFDNQSSCGVNDTTFMYNTAGKKGGAVAVGSGIGPSYIEFHRCIFDSSTTGWPFEDDPQGEGGAIALGAGTTLVLEDCVLRNNYCGKKGGAVTLSGGDNWVNNPGATVIMRNSTLTGNFAELDSAGAIYLGEYAVARIEDQGNNFTGNVCGNTGGVLAATTHTNVTVGGGVFQGNEANEGGGVFWVKGTLNISGGTFSQNEASDSNGGVVFASEDSFVTLSDGRFKGNRALDGGVVFIAEDAELLVRGGFYSDNKARNGGGVFWGEDGGDLKITGGIFKCNTADFGGFLYAEGDGITICEGASVVEHNAVDGGAIYAVEDAVVDWACHLINNKALSGPAIYAREDAEVTVHDVNVSDNVIARGSVMFVVSSTLYTYRVNFSDSTKSFDLSAVQSDSDSTYIAEETTFMGFEGETIVYSEGTLILDDCDFSESSASALVFTGDAKNTVIRNAVLGDKIFEAVIEEASAASVIPVNASFINVALTCSESGSPCNVDSPCLEGDLGVYCQCYERNVSLEKICLDGNVRGLALTETEAPLPTFFPSLLEGDLSLSVDVINSSAALLTSIPASTSTSSQTVYSISNSTPSPTPGGMIWNILATRPHEFISWTVFPSVGLLLPGKTITVRVVGLPSAYFDGTTTVTFVATALGAPNQEEDQGSISATNESSSTVQQTRGVETDDYEDTSTTFVADSYSDDGDDRLKQDVDVTFYHCRSGSFWNVTLSDKNFSSCQLCTNIDGDVEGVDCLETGASTLNLPLRSGYWRSLLNTTNVRKCFNEAACVGGTNVSSVDDYCDTGYNGPFCGVCSAGYGHGAANTCHKCTEEFKGVIYFVLAVAFVLVGIAIVLLGVYLVGGRVAVSKTLYAMRESVRTLHRRSSDFFLRSEVAGKQGNRNNRSAFSQVPNCGRKITSEEDSTAVPNAAMSASSSSATATVHAAVNCKERGSDGDGSIRQAENKEEKEGDQGKEKEKTATAVIGEFLGKLPLSKLKIIIVVWQISSAFADITEVPFPGVYDKFLSVIGIFSFDLGWILSAACLTVDLHFYHQLLIVTIGPMLLLSLLGITFYLGSRALRSSRRGEFPENNNRNIKSKYVDLSSSRAKPEHDTASTSATLRGSRNSKVGEGSRDHRSRSITISTSLNAISTDSNIADRFKRHVDENEDGPATRGGFLTRRQSVRRIWKDGPGDDTDLEQNHIWWLFARHTTMTLIILYLVYSQVSTVVFQTFACESLEEIGKSYLRADLRIECDTPEHKSYQIYACVMICIYPLGIPTAFWYFLARHRSRINPPVDENLRGLRGEDHVVEKKIEKRKDDPTVAPTSFLWAAYFPDRYYFEICECIRRLLLTGVLVFMPDRAEQVAYGCLFAFISLLAFELLRPHVDELDRVLYRTGCLVIFFTNFLALLIKTDVADPDSRGTAAYAVALIVVNIIFVVLSIWWNTWVTIKAMFSQNHVQGVTIGFDIVGEDNMDALATAIKSKGAKGLGDGGEVKIEMEDMGATSIWERGPSVPEESIDTRSNNSRRCSDQGDQSGQKTDTITASVLISQAGLGSQVPGVMKDHLRAAEPHRRQYLPRRRHAASHGWTAAPQCPTSSTPAADSILECGPKSRGFPYAAMVRAAMPSTPNPPHSAATPAESADANINI